MIVEQEIKADLEGQNVVLVTDGWKDNSKNSIAGVNASAGLKSRLIDLVDTNHDKKDGDAMCDAFGKMIDKTEVEYGCKVVGLCCDNDGGSKKGRNNLSQLILGDYFKECLIAAETSEQAAALLGWILSHQRVRAIFDDAQLAQNEGKDALKYLVGNTTRWNTHCIAFMRLHDLKDVIRTAVFTQEKQILAAQIGAEKNPRARASIKESAQEQFDTVQDIHFWKRLDMVIDDLKPICLAVNINQSDKTRPDQFLLSLAGMFLHFKGHSKPSVASGMVKRIEARWKDIGRDQPLFVLALILNPYEGLNRFGDNAGVNTFTLNSLLTSTYERVVSRPPSADITEEQQALHEEMKLEQLGQISSAFLQYLSNTGVFADFRDNQANFEKSQGKDPVLVWKEYQNDAGVKCLANFAILLLEFLVNQGGGEHDFSDLKIKKTQHRNRLKLPRLEKMSKIGAMHEKCEIHSMDRVQTLLAVPWYADILEGPDLSDDESGGTHGPTSWRREMKKWVEDEQEHSDEEMPAAEDIGRNQRNKKWLPRSLELLFGGTSKKPIQRRKTFNQEVLLMELLSAEADDEAPDDGELEGSGDDYEG
ncbi:ribonuclease H-like domain-containing protein [Mycena floridula]|nr:ribonuclease H-like domain-containing protein [Mycena floridula]